LAFSLFSFACILCETKIKQPAIASVLIFWLQLSHFPLHLNENITFWRRHTRRLRNFLYLMANNIIYLAGNISVQHKLAPTENINFTFARSENKKIFRLTES